MEEQRDEASPRQGEAAPLRPAAEPLLDGAGSQVPLDIPDYGDLRRIAADPKRPLDERLEALEDIADSEVGDTPLSRARNIERQSGLRQLYLKFEGSNPTGTQKDRIAFAHAADALRRGFDVLTGATCGNYGVALALAASMSGLRALVFIPEGYHSKRIKAMCDLGAEIVRIPGDYETAVSASVEQAVENEWYDANPGGANLALQLTAYGQIALEIYDELRDAPAMVALPVSNGTTLVGVYRGFSSLHRRGKTSRMPRLIAGSAHNKNPIVRSFLKNLVHCEDLRPDAIKETPVNEPLINWHSIDGDQALTAIRSTNGLASNATDKGMIAFAKLLRDQEGLHVLPASTAGLQVLLERHQQAPLPPDRYVAILTGRG